MSSQAVKTEMTPAQIMGLARDDIYFRRAYESLIRSKRLTTVFRPGNRSCGLNKGFCENEILTIRLLEKPGDDESLIKPKFIPIDQKVKVVTFEVKKIEEYTGDDFKGSSPDVRDVESLKYHLGLIYNKPAESFTGKEVTRFVLEYL